MKSSRAFIVAGFCGVTLAFALAARTQTAAPDLSGLWAAKLRYGPGVPGPLTIFRDGTEWRADFAGFRIQARSIGDTLSFTLPDRKGAFRGKLTGGKIVGHWIGDITRATGSAFATPVLLEPNGANRWVGNVAPFDDTWTYYLPLRRQSDGTYITYLRNPERNQGRFIPVSRLELKDSVIRLIGHPGSQPDRTIAEGRYDDGTMRILINGDSYDFTKVADSSSAFFPRGNPPRHYSYAPPLKLDDGWPVGRVEDVGISREAIEQFMQKLIDMPMDSVTTSQIHSVLIARHGKLVVEEYFHGYNRYQPHDLRSASKSWVAVLLGAAMHDGVPIKLSTPVYQTMLGTVPGDLDPRKRAMTLEHLISMTAGYDCAADGAPGNEDVMQQQTAEPDWYRYTMNVPLITAPGDTIVYCSAEPNLAAGMLQKIAREPLPEMFYRLVAKPMQMRDYHLFLSPTGNAYGGGGHRFLPRDFMKLAQLMVNEGRWGDRQIMTREWALKSGSPLRNLSRIQQYGWLWNSAEYPYNGKKLRAYFAAGNGGQIFMGIPDLDLVIAFTGGNYADASSFIPQRVLVPQFILPAIH
jgi:CubicO group peptidase (beta-lactamase class C family)